MSDCSRGSCAQACQLYPLGGVSSSKTTARATFCFRCRTCYALTRRSTNALVRTALLAAAAAPNVGFENVEFANRLRLLDRSQVPMYPVGED